MKLFEHKHLAYANAFQPADVVRLLQSGTEYFDTLMALIKAAQSSIQFHTYIFENDSIGTSISNELINAAKRGLEISVIMDGYGSLGFSKLILEEWKYYGIKVHLFSRISLFKNLAIGRRLHHKIFIADEYKSLVGGINIADKYRGTIQEEPWLDFALYIEGDVCRQLKKICDQIEERKFPVFNELKLPKYHGQNIPQINIRQNDWLRNKKQIHYSYLLALEQAEREMYIVASYFLPGRKLRKAMERAAKRGIKIKIVLAGKSDIPTFLNASLYLYRWLLKNGIEVYEWHKSVLHGKLALVDDEWMTIGSFNLNHLSTYASIELNVDVTDKDLVKSTRILMDKLIKSGCHQIDRQRHRGVFQKLFEYVAYIAGRTLLKWITYFPGVSRRI
ncbi:MAG: hypothetical protein IPM92_13155 [Saprospiraceae bacterium]|nr:hypothetical protein [Saprospiraceae bacterium]